MELYRVTAMGRPHFYIMTESAYEAREKAHNILAMSFADFDIEQIPEDAIVTE